MRKSEHDFENFVDGLKIDTEPNPAHRERLRRQMLQAFEQERVSSGKLEVSSGVPALHTSHFTLHTSHLAIAATVLIVAGVAVWSFVGRGPATFRQVRLATQKMPWLYAVVSRYAGDTVRTERHWYNFAAQKAYAVMDDGSVAGWEYGPDPKRLAYSPRLKSLLISDLPAPGASVNLTENLPCVFAAFAATDQVSGSTVQYDSKTIQSFEIEKTEADLAAMQRGWTAAHPGVSVNGKAVSLFKATILADPRTRHVVAASVEYQGGSGVVLAREEWVMSYPPSGPASLCDLGVPASAPVVDRTRQRIGTPGLAPTPTADGGQTTEDRSVLRPASSGFRLAPVEIRLPKPMFAGTPQDERMPNLEQPRGSPRPPFLAPVGTMNVALGRPVSSSDPEPVIGSLSAITDGDKEATDGSFVELSPGPQYVTIDLREPCEIEGVLVWHYHRWPRAYRDVVVLVSDDPTFQGAVTTIFNNDTHDILGLGAGRDLSYIETYEGKLMEGKGARGRYVRLYSNGNSHDDLNHYIEVEVYGRPLR